MFDLCLGPLHCIVLHCVVYVSFVFARVCCNIGKVYVLWLEFCQSVVNKKVWRITKIPQLDNLYVLYSDGVQFDTYLNDPYSIIHFDQMYLLLCLPKWWGYVPGHPFYIVSDTKLGGGLGTSTGKTHVCNSQRVPWGVCWPQRSSISGQWGSKMPAIAQEQSSPQ